jgi:Rad3-related DNA helicase
VRAPVRKFMASMCQPVDSLHSISSEHRYSQSAIRAVNQALGRVIRHRNDFGAVLLADERFAYTSVQSQLSVWIRPHVQRHESFGKGLARYARPLPHFVSPAN